MNGKRVCGFRRDLLSQVRLTAIGCLCNERFLRLHLCCGADRMVLGRAHNGHSAPGQYKND